MAEWRKVAKAAILADNRIDTREVNVLRDSLLADGKINQSEMDFLHELRSECKSAVKTFNEFYLEAAKNYLLIDGVIGKNQAKWLRKALLGTEGAVISEDDKSLLKELKAEAKETSPEFEELYQECMNK